MQYPTHRLSLSRRDVSMSGITEICSVFAGIICRQWKRCIETKQVGCRGGRSGVLPENRGEAEWRDVICRYITISWFCRCAVLGQFIGQVSPRVLHVMCAIFLAAIFFPPTAVAGLDGCRPEGKGVSVRAASGEPPAAGPRGCRAWGRCPGSRGSGSWRVPGPRRSRWRR